VAERTGDLMQDPGVTPELPDWRSQRSLYALGLAPDVPFEFPGCVTIDYRDLGPRASFDDTLVETLIEEAEEVTEAYSERLHPRGRKGQFIRKFGLKAGEVETPEGLHHRWADLDRDLLPYAGHPRAPQARKIIAEQEEITAELHHFNADPGGPGGIGQPGGPRDVVVVGAGPAGLSAAIYGATEGLDTLMIDANDEPGGQSRMSSRIENVLGFPAGITGKQYAKMGLEQATRTGADCEFGVRVQRIEVDPKTKLKHLHLSDGRTVDTRAVVLAGGVEFRKAALPGADAEGVVYGDSKELRKACGLKEGVIVGGANSAGQAAIDAAAHLPHVTLVVRSNIEKGMSEYLIAQLRSDPKVTILENAEVASIHKSPANHVDGVTLKDGSNIPAKGIGFFIGSAPKTDWTGAERDDHGYLKVGGEGRAYLETSLPGVFAAGDMRSNSVHRVITAAGDGAQAIAQVHQFVPTVGADDVQEALYAPDAADAWMEQMNTLDDEEPFTGFEQFGSPIDVEALAEWTERIGAMERGSILELAEGATIARTTGETGRYKVRHGGEKVRTVTGAAAAARHVIERGLTGGTHGGDSRD
jgi:thioredoxin reductase